MQYLLQTLYLAPAKHLAGKTTMVWTYFCCKLQSLHFLQMSDLVPARQN